MMMINYLNNNYYFYHLLPQLITFIHNSVHNDLNRINILALYYLLEFMLKKKKKKYIHSHKTGQDQ